MVKASEDMVSKILSFAKSTQGMRDYLDKTFGDDKDVPIEKGLAFQGLQRLDLTANSVCCLFLL